VGQNGRPFEIIKLRTMVGTAGENGPKLTESQDSRITRAAQWLVKKKLDEIPQLITVSWDEMGSGGRRPEAPELVALYASEPKRLLDPKSGLTRQASPAFVGEGEAACPAGRPGRLLYQDPNATDA